VKLPFIGGEHATSKTLQWRLEGETEFGHNTPITGAEMTVGPFAPGTVEFRTRVGNSADPSVLSAVKSATVT